MSIASPLLSAPDSAPSAASLAAVERALAELRRGGLVVLRDAEGRAGIAAAAEACSEATLRRLQGLAQDATVLITTRRRAEAVGIEIPPHLAAPLGDRNGPITLDLPGGVPPDVILQPGEPDAAAHAAVRHFSRPVQSHAPLVAAAAIELVKLARLLPAVVVGPLARDPLGKRRQWAQEQDLLYLSVEDALAYRDAAGAELRAVAEARVPLEGAENARIVAWRPSDGGVEQLAIVIGDIDPMEPVLIRLHSECFTGDLLGSLRCDCGDQLRGAIAEIARAGSGVLLYLAQEGRGIGLVNKLRAYKLQDAGFDTIDANEQLGFDADERAFLPAATMLRHMGIRRVRVMTNNPDKLEQLARHGVEIVERVPHAFTANGHNEGYLRTKAQRAGHLL